MQTLQAKKKIYQIDGNGFLIDPGQWDKDFAEGMASELGIPTLTPTHRKVLNYIRDTYLETGSCPVVHETCKVHNLSIKDLEKLFPTGYQRGACKLAGVPSLVDGGKIIYPWVSYPSPEASKTSTGKIPITERVYRVNIQGFLIDPNEWDEDYATFKARELQMTGSLSEKHWQVITFLRAEYEKTRKVPTIYATCSAIGIDIDQFSELFPSGYNRGAVRIAGLNPSAPLQTGAAAARK